MEEYARGLVTGGTLFEELGFFYVGPIDGHNLDHLLPVLKNVRDAKDGPILRSRRDAKGQGLRSGGGFQRQISRRREVRRRDRQAGQGQGQCAVLHQGLRREPGEGSHRRTTGSWRSPRRCRRAPASTSSTRRFPSRTFDVGIAEQHAVTFAAGLATEGYKPFAAIYSTFLQRAYDQIVHDVAIQRLPVRFALDRAGLVGADGPTHAGSFDVAYLGCLPGFVLMAAADEAELVHMVATSVAIDDRPPALRYPRGDGVGVDMPEVGVPLEIGKGRIIREGSSVALLSFGTRLQECLLAAETLAAHGLTTTVADARFAKPLDIDLVLRLAREHEVLITVEEGSIGGFGSYVLQTLAEHGALENGLKVRCMVLPDVFIDQDSPAAMYAQAGLDAKGIVAKVFEALGRDIAPRCHTELRPGRGCPRRPLTYVEATALAAFRRGLPLVIRRLEDGDESDFGSAAGILRRRRARHRDRRARPAEVRAAGLRPPRDRAQQARGRKPEGQGRAFRRGPLGGPRECGHDLQRPWRGQERRGRGGGARSCRCSTRPARW